jgi:diguanylate cyclase (GGDEF)-like protein
MDKEPQQSADMTHQVRIRVVDPSELEQQSMFSLKRYLGLSLAAPISPTEPTQSSSISISVLRRILVEFGECAALANPGCRQDLANAIIRDLEALGPQPAAEAIVSFEGTVRDLLRNWARKTSRYYDRQAGETKDLLLVMARTAESLSHKDDRCARQLTEVTSQLESIKNLDDLMRIRTAIENSARELKNSIARMTCETKAVIDHLRVEVSTCQTKLEKAEHLACLDSLTGLGSRRWVEGRIQQRIESGSSFAIALIDINGFRKMIDHYGNLVGDLLLKEFARELRSSCRFTDIVGRWGGDEFIVVLDHCGAEVQAQIARLHKSVSKPYHVPGRTGYVKARLDITLGLAEYRDGDHLQNLLERADAELCSHRQSSLGDLRMA